MIISIGCDHGGYLLKKDIVNHLKNLPIEVFDHGCFDTESVDYPIYGNLVCSDLITNKCDFGILICTTGIGMSIVANKHKGVRAALVQDINQARLSREHNDCNCLCLGANYVTNDEAYEIINTFINTKFACGRHQRRVDLINKLDE